MDEFVIFYAAGKESSLKKFGTYINGKNDILGQETTSSLLAHSLVALLKHPEIMQR